MIYQHTWPAILSGDKIETTRVITDSERVVLRPHTSIIEAVYVRGRLKWGVGRTYAVQPGRGCHTLYWKPSPARDGRAIVYSSTGKLIPVGGGYRRAEVKLLAIEVVELAEISEYNAYCEGYLALGGNHGGALPWFKTVWKGMYGTFNKKQLVFRLRFELVGREILYGIKDDNDIGLQRLADMDCRDGLLSPAAGYLRGGCEPGDRRDRTELPIGIL